MLSCAPRPRWGLQLLWPWADCVQARACPRFFSTTAITGSLRFACPLAAVAAVSPLPLNCMHTLQARPEQGMTKESYLDAVFRGIADYYASSRRAAGDPWVLQVSVWLAASFLLHALCLPESAIESAGGGRCNSASPTPFSARHASPPASQHQPAAFPITPVVVRMLSFMSRLPSFQTSRSACCSASTGGSRQRKQWTQPAWRYS